MYNRFVISKNDIFFAFIIALECKLFYLIKLPGTLGTLANTLLVVIGSIILYAEFIFRTKKFGDKKSIFSNYIFYVFFLLFIELVFTTIKYRDERFTDSLKEILPYITLLSFFYLSYLAKIDFMKMVKWLIRFSSIVALLFILQAFLYNNFGMSFLKIYGFNYGEIKIITRSMGIRYIGTSFIEYMSFLSIGMLFFPYTPKKHKKIYLTNVILVSVYSFYVSQTRSSIVMLLITIFIFFMFSENKNILIKLAMIGTAIGVFVLIYSQVVEMVNTWETDWSLYHRVDEINYYWNRFLSTPIFGNGLLRDSPSSNVNDLLVHGGKGYSYVDVGFIGHLGHFGVLGLLMYVIYFEKCFKRIKVDGIRNPICIAVIIASALSLINLSLLDAGRIFEITVFMAVIEGSSNFIREKDMKIV